MNDTAFQQLRDMRLRPDCPNLFDVKATFELAIRLQMIELAEFIFMDTKGYRSFILTEDKS